jgi:diguanylate cyclase (GGDEF)-like protein
MARNTGAVQILFIANLLYTLGYALELASNSIDLKLFFNHMQYWGVTFIAPLWLIICIRYCCPGFKWDPLKVGLIMLLPAATLVLNMTHQSNGIFYSSYAVQEWNGLSVLIFQKGVWYYVEVAAHVLFTAATVVLYARAFRKAVGIRRRQAFLLFVLSASGFVLSATSFFSKQTSAVDFVVLLLDVSSILLLITLFKYELFELVPLANSQLFNGTDHPVLVLTDSMMVVRANSAAKQIFSELESGQEFISLQSLFKHDEDFIAKLLKDDESTTEIKSGDMLYFYSAKLTRLKIKERAIKKDFGYLVVFSDVTSHINLVHNLEVEAATDSLTGLLNRRSFFQLTERVMEKATAAAETVSLIMIDIDHFKNVNDEYGHQAGDFVLKEVSRIICSKVRENDIIARYGGEEFIILLPATGGDAAVSAANRICSAIRHHDMIAEDRIIHLTISIGVTCMEANNTNAVDRLIYIADKALYNAKQKGRNRVSFLNGTE